MSAAAAILLVVGALFCLLAALGVLRFPDLYTRLHASSKAGLLGVGLILLGAGLASGDIAVIARCVIGMVLIALTSPISAHLLARAALRSRDASLAEITSINEFDPDQ